MYKLVFLICYSSILLSTIVGLATYKRLNVAMRFIVMMLAVTSVSELCCYVAVSTGRYADRPCIYHVYNIIQAFLISGYFIYAVKPVQKNRILLYSGIFWVAAGLGNLLFLQPLRSLNSNMLVLESFVFITAALYFIYRTLKNDGIENMFRYPQFQMSMVLLIYWSSNMFFWAFVKILYNDHWRYIGVLMTVQEVIEVLSYLAIGAVLLYSGRKTQQYEEH